MNVFSSMINHTIFHLHICLSLLLTEIRLAGWSAVFVCLCVCLYVCFVVLFPPSSLQVTIKERSLPQHYPKLRHTFTYLRLARFTVKYAVFNLAPCRLNSIAYNSGEMICVHRYQSTTLKHRMLSS